MRCNEVGQYGVIDILLSLCPSHQWSPVSDLSFSSYPTLTRQNEVVELGLVGTLQTPPPFCGAHCVAELLSLPHNSKGCDSGPSILPLPMEAEGHTRVLLSIEVVRCCKCLTYFCGKVSVGRRRRWTSIQLSAVSQCPISAWVVSGVECIDPHTTYAIHQQSGLPANKKIKWDSESHNIISKMSRIY